MNPTLAIVIAHYHPEGRVATNLFKLVQHLAKLTKRIVFVSTDINDAAIEQLTPFAQVIRRENIGYDFWSYKVGIEALGDRSKFKRLVLLNSSFVTIDPHTLMSQFLTPVGDALIKGLTISAEKDAIKKYTNIPIDNTYHVQSYLVSFEHKDLINSSAFNDWWSSMEIISDRNEVIARYEIGMSNYFSQLGYPLVAAFKPTNSNLFISMGRIIANQQLFLSDNKNSIVTLDLNMAREFNPSHYLWDYLYQQFKILKIDLLRDNPHRQQLDIINSLEPEVIELINEALQ